MNEFIVLPLAFWSLCFVFLLFFFFDFLSFLFYEPIELDLKECYNSKLVGKDEIWYFIIYNHRVLDDLWSDLIFLDYSCIIKAGLFSDVKVVRATGLILRSVSWTLDVLDGVWREWIFFVRASIECCVVLPLLPSLRAMRVGFVSFIVVDHGHPSFFMICQWSFY